MLFYFHSNVIYSEYGEEEVEGHGAQLQEKSLTAVFLAYQWGKITFPPKNADSYSYYKKNEFLGKQNKK